MPAKSISQLLNNNAYFYECSGISDCVSYERIISVMQSYMHHDFDVHSINIQDLLNDYHHLLDVHQADFEQIADSFPSCNVRDCRVFHRHYRERISANSRRHPTNPGHIGNIFPCDMTEHLDASDQDRVHVMAAMEILDTIHCYYTHSFDTGHRMRSRRTSTSFRESVEGVINGHRAYHAVTAAEPGNPGLVDNNLSSSQNVMLNKFSMNGISGTESEQHDGKGLSEGVTNGMTTTIGANRRHYAYGVVFEYDVNHKFSSKMNGPNFIRYVPMKYQSFKEEIVSLSKKTDLGLTQWLYQYKKADLHFSSYYCRAFITKYNKTYCEALDGPIRRELQIQHLLALMFYCNFDALQFEFSKTYRRASADETNKSVADRHSSFWHLGKWIKEAVHHFGTRINSEDSHETFYTGISPMIFSNACYGYFNTPLSTTTDVTVAACFANENGLIVELCHGAASYPMMLASAKYFAMHWLSRYSSEHECLFIQCGDKPLIFKNILCIQHGIEYRHVIQALRLLDDIFNHHRLARQGTVDPRSLDIAEQMVLQRLTRCLTPQSEIGEKESDEDAEKHGVVHIDSYGRCLVDEFCRNQRKIWINWDRLTQHSCDWIPRLFVDESGEWINLKVINSLFPNLESIEVRWKLKVKRAVVAKILHHLQRQRIEAYLKLQKRRQAKSKSDSENENEKKEEAAEETVLLKSVRIAIDRKGSDQEMITAIIDEFQDKFEMLGFIVYRRADRHDLCIESINVENCDQYE